jgi:hypothetical protein
MMIEFSGELSFTISVRNLAHVSIAHSSIVLVVNSSAWFLFYEAKRKLIPLYY